MTYPGVLPDDGIDRLRAALISANYTTDGIAERLGPDAVAAATRNDVRAAIRCTEDPDPLATLIRLYLCGQVEPEDRVRRALGDLGLGDAASAGLIARDGDGIRAGLDLEPYEPGWWVLSDVAGGQRLESDHVLGIGGAATTLVNAVVRDTVTSALDLGTGCGVQALHLSRHAQRVTATDVSERALRFAATAARLAGLDWDMRQGDMIGPVGGQSFDLVVSNPPFVVGPGTATHRYRDSGRPGDGVSAELAAASPRILNPGGTLQFLANWLHVRGEDWAERVAGWFAGTGMDVWAIQREVSDPIGYVDLWLRDAGEDREPGRVDAWLDWFDEHKVEAVGFGLVTARNQENRDPVVRVETLRQPLARPFGPQVRAWFERQDWLRSRPSVDGLLATAFRTAPGLTLRQDAERSDAGWDVTTQMLVQTAGLGWSEEVDPVILALVTGCDGSTSMSDQLAVMAAAYEAPESTMRGMASVLVPHLVERGFIEPVS